MVTDLKKPRMVFFQWDHEGLPKFLLLHMQLHVKCLSEFFEVIIIKKDCDYQQICDKYHPDVTLFESGYRTSISRKITIKNTSAYPEIPKLGLHNGDPWCECRIGFISDMAQWGIETFFTISTTTAEHTPEIANNLFVWPNFIDSDIYHDYGHAKIVPVLFNGYINPLYPWRQKIHKIISNCYPSLIFPHLGYESYSPVMIHGEQYAKTINASWFVPSCGTLAKEVVRKHFEIPGSKSCLITEKTPSIEAAGFVDMQNCVFADEKDVLDKLNYLFKNTHELEKIIESGYDLVHSRHTLKQRNQIYQWYILHKNLGNNQKIVQVNPFEPLIIVDTLSNNKNNTPIKCEGVHLNLMRQGDNKLWSGEYEEAEAFYLKCLNYIHWMCEPKLKLALCSLYKGNANVAYNWVYEPIQNILRDYKALDPDPVDWAYLIISLLCQGKLNEAALRANQFPFLHHSELDRTRFVINYLLDKDDSTSFKQNLSAKPRYSIHQLPQLSFDDWLTNLSIMLKNCQQLSYLEALSKLVVSKKDSSVKIKNRSVKGIRRSGRYIISARTKWLEKLNHAFEVLHIPNPRPGLPPISEIGYIIRLLRWARINDIKKIMLRCKNRVKDTLNLWISFKSAERNNDEFFQAVKYLLQKEDIRDILIIGSLVNLEKLQLFISHVSNKLNRPTMFCIEVSNTKLPSLQSINGGDCSINVYEPELGSFGTSSKILRENINKVKQENGISCFDLVFIDSLAFKAGVELDEIQGANFIVIDGVDTLEGFKNRQKFITEQSYVLEAQNPLQDNGYVIFRKLNNYDLQGCFSG